MKKKPKRRSPPATTRTKPATPPADEGRTTADLRYCPRPGRTRSETFAAVVAEGKVGNAAIVNRWTSSVATHPDTGPTAVKPTIGSLHQAIQDLTVAVRSGDLNAEADRLVAHNVALDAVFGQLMLMALGNTEIRKFELLLRMGLRAQAAIRANVETLAEMKNPPVVFARQANVTSGPQQVNNGILAPASNATPAPNRLLGSRDARLDIEPPRTAATSDPPLAPVGVLDGAANGPG